MKKALPFSLEKVKPLTTQQIALGVTEVEEGKPQLNIAEAGEAVSALKTFAWSNWKTFLGVMAWLMIPPKGKR